MKNVPGEEMARFGGSSVPGVLKGHEGQQCNCSRVMALEAMVKNDLR